MFCQKCGKELPEGSVACNFCGAATVAVMQPEPEPVLEPITCKNCGATIQPGQQFCPGCLVKAPWSDKKPTTLVKKSEHGILFWGVIFIGAVLILIVGTATLSAFVFGMAHDSPSTTTSHTPLVTATPTEDSRSAIVKFSKGDGHLIADVTNVGSISKAFILSIDYYDGDIKIDSRMPTTPIIAPGETGRVKLYPPPDTTNYRLNSVAVNIGGSYYRVYFDVIYP